MRAEVGVGRLAEVELILICHCLDERAVFGLDSGDHGWVLGSVTHAEVLFCHS